MCLLLFYSLISFPFFFLLSHFFPLKPLFSLHCFKLFLFLFCLLQALGLLVSLCFFAPLAFLVQDFGSLVICTFDDL